MIKTKFAAFIVLCIFLSNSLVYAENLKIGVLTCLTGPCAKDGKDVLRGLELAAEEINSNNAVLGKKIELVVEDTADATGGAKSVTAYKKLRRENIDLFIGPTWTPGGMALAPLVKKQNVFMVSASQGLDVFNVAGDNIFNTHGNDEQSTRAMAKRIVQQGYRKFAVIGSQQPWELAQSNFFIDELKKLGMTPELITNPLPDSSDFRLESIKIKSSKVDAVFISSYLYAPLLAKQLRRINYEGSLFLVRVTPEILERAQGALDGSTFSYFINVADEFKLKFKNKYSSNRTIEPTSACSYDTLMMMIKVIQDCQCFDVKEISNRFQKLNYQGYSGQIKFDNRGAAIRKITYYKVINGKPSLIE